MKTVKEMSEITGVSIREQALLKQKKLLEQKRNRLNGIIELITDVMKGVNTMGFEAFTNKKYERK